MGFSKLKHSFHFNFSDLPFIHAKLAYASSQEKGGWEELDEGDDEDPIAVYLDGKSKQHLLEANLLPAQLDPRILLERSPTRADQYTWGPLMGETVTATVRAQATCKALFTDVLLPRVSYGGYPLSSSVSAMPVLGPSGVLDVAMTARVLKNLNLDIRPTPLWTGVVQAGVKSFTVTVEPLQPTLELSGMICSQKRYNAANHTCQVDKDLPVEAEQEGEDQSPGVANEDISEKKESNQKGECPLCKFFEASPCKEVYKSWKACLDKVQEKGGDLFEDCGQVTLQLRECIMKHPEYFEDMLQEEHNDEESGEKDTERIK